MKKVGEVIKTVITVVVALIAVAVMIFTVVSVNTFNRNDRSLFGYNAYIVLSDSMKATHFASGDLVLVKKTDPETLQPGDIIAFTSQNSSNYGEVVTHMIREKTTDENGNPGFITYGTTTGTDDETVVTYPYILGKYQKHFKGVGKFFNFLKTVPGYITCILLPFLVLVAIEGINCVRRFREYKKVQEEEFLEERKQLEKEREETKEMLDQLQALKAEFEAEKAKNTPENTSEISEEKTETEENPEGKTETKKNSEEKAETEENPEEKTETDSEEK